MDRHPRDPYGSPASVFLIVTAAIFIVETVVMIVIHVIPLEESGLKAAALDSVLLTTVLSPVLYRLVFVPMTRHLRKIREEEEKTRAVTEASLDAIIMMDHEGRVVFWNDAARRSFGYEAGEATGKDLHGLIIPEAEREAFARGFKAFLETGTGPVVGTTTEVNALRKGGEKFRAELSVSSVRIKERWHAVGIVRDITQRHLAQKELDQRIEDLERFAKATVERELRMKELRDRVKDLECQLARTSG